MQAFTGMGAVPDWTAKFPADPPGCTTTSAAPSTLFLTISRGLPVPFGFNATPHHAVCGALFSVSMLAVC